MKDSPEMKIIRVAFKSWAKSKVRKDINSPMSSDEGSEIKVRVTEVTRSAFTFRHPRWGIQKMMFDQMNLEQMALAVSDCPADQKLVKEIREKAGRVQIRS